MSFVPPWFAPRGFVPKPTSRYEFSVCEFCGANVVARRWGGYKFWESVDGKPCPFDPYEVRPFGGEHDAIETFNLLNEMRATCIATSPLVPTSS